ncbi:MAG: hypothetical protein ACAF41_33460 (plasmid) [Leptolyngbya sp. BL-A-14]
MEELLTQATVAVEWLSLSYVAGSLAWRTHLHFTQPCQTRFQSRPRRAPALRELSPQPSVQVVPSPKRSPVEQLRQQCQQAGIKWRDAHGKHKHLKKHEMLAALQASNVIPFQR